MQGLKVRVECFSLIAYWLVSSVQGRRLTWGARGETPGIRSLPGSIQVCWCCSGPDPGVSGGGVRIEAVNAAEAAAPVWMVGV